MSDAVIKIQNLTKDYSAGRGVFDTSFEVEKGEIFGFLGTNGSGKTTTIRSLMGFIKPDKGSCSVLGNSSWENHAEIMQYVSYVPGEIAFPSFRTGTAFLKNHAQFLGVTDYTYMNHIIKELKLDPSADLKRMSKGMKQKTALTAALMGEKKILVLDEPTTGLDPLMRDAFLNLIREEKKKGSTVLMSGHIFEEIEEICDRVAMIKDGRIVDITDLHIAKHNKNKCFIIEFKNTLDAEKFACGFKGTVKNGVFCTVEVTATEIKSLMQALKAYKIQSLHEKHFSLEQHFMDVYESEER